MESILKGYQDPRVDKYFSAAKTPDNNDDPAGVKFPYEGMRNGQSKEAKQGIAFNNLASDMAPIYIAAETADRFRGEQEARNVNRSRIVK